MTLAKRLEGIFFNPRPVFNSLAEKPVWADALILTLVALIAFNLVVGPLMQRDQLRLMKDNTVLKERMGEEAFGKMIEQMENPSAVRKIVQGVIVGPLFSLVGLLIQALALLVLARFLSPQGAFVHVLAALVHAAWIDKLLGNAVRLALALARGSLIQVSTGLAALFPKLEVTSTAYIVLAQVDLFQLWMFGVLAIGLAAIFKIELKKALVLSYGLWLLKALVNVGLLLVQMSFLR